MTVVFPDSTLPEPTNGGFDNQDEFRKYVTKLQDGKWNSALHARPLAERLADYRDDTIADAFPLLFPYGYTGLAEDPSVMELRTADYNKKHLARNRIEVLRKYLMHRKPAFHAPMFNLIVENLVMKQTIFEKTQMFCNVKASDHSSMGEKYGAMSGDALERAIHDVRNNVSLQHSNSKEHQYLKSISAVCKHLPHSNEASLDARTTYFSYLMRFGLPGIFLTISPDDLRNYRIVVYALTQEEKISVDVKDLSEDQIVADFKVRQQARFDHPGLCAEEYERIIQLVIKHIFNWDEVEQKNKGVGLFAEIMAWCIATEEQGRKSLHAHILLFIKDWQRILRILQRRRKVDDGEDISYQEAVATTKRLYKNACSAELFADFEPNMPLSEKPPFHHENCRGKRRGDVMRFTVQAVPDDQLRAMRHKRLCHEYNGQIATCLRCKLPFTVNDIVSKALSYHFGKSGEPRIMFPEGNATKRLDRFVYEYGKDFSWHDDGDSEVLGNVSDRQRSKALRYFASNALTNVHFVSHATRCFKKGSECYANLPDAVTDYDQIIYNDEVDVWSDWCGRKEERWMFRLQPKRPVDSVYMNTHNPTLTSLLGCNNNVMLGMNGRLVLYVTGYNVKSQQKEERMAFEGVSKVLVKLLQNQVSVYPDSSTNHSLPFADNDSSLHESQSTIC
jgi:hypothetical protein